MLNLQTSPTTRPLQPVERPVNRNGLSRLFATAVVSPQFREVLLRDSKVALAKGYHGQPFILTDEEQRIIHSIRADSLTELARQVNFALRRK
jgi:hypothetical protein